MIHRPINVGGNQGRAHWEKSAAISRIVLADCWTFLVGPVALVLWTLIYLWLVGE